MDYKESVWYTANYCEHDGARGRRDFVTSIVENEYGEGKLKVLKASLVDSTYYAAVQRENGTVFGLVVKTNYTWRWNDGHTCTGPWLDYRFESEQNAPADCECPITILRLLSPTDNEFSLAWRTECKSNADKKSLYRKIKNTPGGTIRFRSRSGSERILFRKPGLTGLHWSDGKWVYGEKYIKEQTYNYILFDEVKTV